MLLLHLCFGLSAAASHRSSPLSSVAQILRHTVAHWPAGATPTRWVVRVRMDTDAVLLGLPFNETAGLCILHERTGRRVRNLHVPNSQEFQLVQDGTGPPAQGAVVFEPASGPGEYELYMSCADDAEGAPPDEAFLAVAARPAGLPLVHILRDEPRTRRPSDGRGAAFSHADGD